MKRNLYLGTALLLSMGHAAIAAPVVLTGKNVRFILDDAQLTAFGGTQPKVQDDTLIFAPPATTYKAEALAPDKPVGFKEQYLEFNVEAIGGQTLKNVALKSAGSSTAQGQAGLTKTLAFGKLNVKDKLLVNRAVEFSNVESTAGVWQALDTGTDPKGVEAAINVNSRTIAISTTHSLRALALDKTGNAAINNQEGVSFKIVTAEATNPDRLLDWAESMLPGLGIGSATATLSGNEPLQCNKTGETCKDLGSLSYRCYPAAKLCYGIKGDTAYVYNFDDGIVRTIGPTKFYFDQAVKSGF